MHVACTKGLFLENVLSKFRLRPDRLLSSQQEPEHQKHAISLFKDPCAFSGPNHVVHYGFNDSLYALGQSQSRQGDSTS